MAQRVLVVEDNDDWRAIMALIFARLGYTVLQAVDGSDAVEKAVSEHPHLIIMDYRMPKMNGLEATTALKGNPVTKDIPVIINTSKTLQEDELAWFCARARMVLSKSALSREIVAGLVQQIVSGQSAGGSE